MPCEDPMENPYETPKEEGSPPRRIDSVRLGWAIFSGAMWSIGSSFPIAALLVSVYQFPFPMGGMVSGPTFIPMAIIGLLLYGVLLGGFFLLAAAGGISGAIAYAVSSTPKIQRIILPGLAVGASFLLLLVLASLDSW